MQGLESVYAGTRVVPPYTECLFEYSTSPHYRPGHLQSLYISELKLKKVSCAFLMQEI